MSHLHVTPEELTATASSLDGRVQTLQGTRSQVHGATVPAGAFGRIPGLGPHIDQIYTQHVADSTEVLQEATDGLDSAVKSLQATALGFLELEKHTAHTIHGSVPA
jgi:hypothetical protein